MKTTVQLEKETVDLINKTKEHPRQTYDEVIKTMVLTFRNLKKKDQYDKFLHEAQKEKMKELWDNPKDNELWG